MKSIPRVEKYKVKAFCKCHWTETVANMLYNGEAESQQLSLLCQAFIDANEDIDVTDMEATMSKPLGESLSISRALLVLIDMPFDATHCDEVEKLSLDKVICTVDASTSPVAIISAAITSSPWYIERQEKWSKALPIIHEKESVFETANLKCDGFMKVDALQNGWANEFTTMMEDCAIILSKVEGKMIDAFVQKLIASLTRCMQDLFLPNLDKLTLDEADSVSKMLHSASLVVPHNASIVDWQSALAEKTPTGRR